MDELASCETHAEPRLIPAMKRTVASRAAGLGILAFALAWLSLSFGRDPGYTAAIWPVDGAILICLIRADGRRWPAYLGAALVGTLMAELAVGDAPGLAIVLTFCHGLAALICAVGVRRFIGKRVDLSRPRDLTVFCAVTGAGSAISATLGACGLHWLTGAPVLRDLMIGAAAEDIGLVLVTATFLALPRGSLRPLWARAVIGRNLLLFLAHWGLLTAIFSQTVFPAQALTVVTLLLMTFYMELSGAALGLLVAAVIVSFFTLAGYGPLAAVHGADRIGRISQHAIVVQLYLVLASILVYPIGATLAQRRRLRDSLAASLATAEAANAKLLEAQHWKTLAEQVAGVGYWRLNGDSMTVTWSEEMFRIYELEVGEPPSLETVMGLFHPDDAELFMQSPFTPGGSKPIEVRIRRADGCWRVVLSRAIAETGPVGKVAAVFGTMLDITDLKLADEALRTSESRFRLLAENATDIIVQCDLEGRVTYVSPSLLAVTGYAPEEMIGQDALMLCPPEEQAEVRKAMAHALFQRPEDAGGRVEYRFRRKDGSEGWLEDRPTLLFDNETGQPIAISDVARDVTQRKMMEADLRRERAAAEAAARAKSEFLANMSHEIRTPLNSIVGFSGLLRQEDELPDAAKLFVRRIATASQSLLSVVNDILDFSKLEAGQVDLDPQAFDLSGFIAETLDLVTPQAVNKGLTLHCVIDDQTPDRVCADSSRLRQILLNLLGNAIKFTEMGGLTVKVGYREADSELSVSLTDTGPGISPEAQARLFQRFSQVDGSISRRHGGTGLGLAICRNLVELMGGEIGVESALGQGATFWFRIAAPAAVEDDRPAALLVERQELESAHILVVDDMAVNRELVRAMLAPFDLTFEEADSGVEAVNAALRAPFDLILMDLQMPEMDGLAAARAIRQAAGLNRDTPIVALSANVLPAHVEACIAAGMDDHMAKPVNPAVLLGMIERWAGARHASLAKPMALDTLS